MLTSEIQDLLATNRLREKVKNILIQPKLPLDAFMLNLSTN